LTYSKPMCYQIPLYAQIAKLHIYTDLLKKEPKSLAFPNFKDIIAQQYINFDVIYTDGSVSEKGEVGFAFYSGESGTREMGRLPYGSSILLSALQCAERNNLSDVVFCSDSYSVLSALKPAACRPSYRGILLQIKNVLFRAHTSDRNFHLIWIPSHSNIPGNEEVDRMAKRATSMTPQPIKLEYQEFEKVLKKDMMQSWHREWEAATRQKAQIFYTSNNTIANKSWFNVYGSLRREVIVLVNRLRSGHVLTPAFRYRIGQTDSPLCACGEFGDLNHLFSNAY